MFWATVKWGKDLRLELHSRCPAQTDGIQSPWGRPRTMTWPERWNEEAIDQSQKGGFCRCRCGPGGQGLAGSDGEADVIHNRARTLPSGPVCHILELNGRVVFSAAAFCIHFD